MNSKKTYGEMLENMRNQRKKMNELAYDIALLIHESELTNNDYAIEMNEIIAMVKKHLGSIC